MGFAPALGWAARAAKGEVAELAAAAALSSTKSGLHHVCGKSIWPMVPVDTVLAIDRRGRGAP
jgi:hypothetical protein